MPIKFRSPGIVRGTHGLKKRAAEGDVIAKLEMIAQEFESITEQVNDFGEEEREELKKQFSKVSDDFGDCIVSGEKDMFTERVEELTTEEKQELCGIFEEVDFAPWNWDLDSMTVQT